MVVAAELPRLSTVLVTAAIDSINPCAIGVLILLVSIMVVLHTRRRMLWYGLAYIAAVYVTYLLAGLGILYFLAVIPLVVSQYISITVGSLVAFAGVVEIKDYFWYGRGITLAIPPRQAKRIHDMTRRITLPGVIILGAFVAAVELPCTGAPYMAILLLLSQNFNLAAFLLLLLYNLIFVAPLLVILVLVYSGTKIQAIKRWKQEKRGMMRFFIGITLIFLGWLLILIANGTVSLG
ncbi:hypothetical protein HY642_01985 [Candidatus Woesearchaeota archaeon]|nr:hypothetical protein [Candidatus Woesearchaeota archaeon]